jgi:hypothetical protein
MLTNMEAQRLGAETKSIAVRSQSNDDAAYVAVDQLIRNLNLKSYLYTPGLDLQSLDRGHALPIVVDARRLPKDTITLTSYLFDYKPKSIILLVDSFDVFSESSLGGWVTLDNCLGVPQEFPYENIPGILFSGLCRLQEIDTGSLNLQDFPLLFSTMIDYIEVTQPITTATISKLVNGIVERIGGDWNREVCTTDTVRSMFPVLFMMKQNNTRDPAEGLEPDSMVSIFIRQQLEDFRKLTGCPLKTEDVRYLLRRAGILQGIHGNSISLKVSDWRMIQSAYNSLLPKT